jgi:pyruvate/2-oxoglutarate dehydrogenase complex dihydrolipoamide acyltransferase (E2) component
MAEIVEIVLAKWGMNMVEATVVEWKKAIGDHVEEGEAVATIETDKVDAEVIAPASGVLVEILVPPDHDARVGESLGRIQKDG